MMVVWGNQRFSAIRAYCDTIIKEKVSNIDITRAIFSFYCPQPMSLLQFFSQRLHDNSIYPKY